MFRKLIGILDDFAFIQTFIHELGHLAVTFFRSRSALTSLFHRRENRKLQLTARRERTLNLRLSSMFFVWIASSDARVT